MANQGSQDRPYYTPREIDKRWLENAVALLKNGGTLAYPATQLIYTVDHVNRTLTLQNPDQIDVDFGSFVTHCQTIDVGEAIGWKVVP